jgi:hypothetical protein
MRATAYRESMWLMGRARTRRIDPKTRMKYPNFAAALPSPPLLLPEWQRRRAAI